MALNCRKELKHSFIHSKDNCKIVRGRRLESAIASLHEQDFVAPTETRHPGVSKASFFTSGQLSTKEATVKKILGPLGSRENVVVSIGTTKSGLCDP